MSSPLTLAVAAATALLSCFLASAAVLIGFAAGGAATDYQAGQACPDTYGPVLSRENMPPDQAAKVVETARRQATAHGFVQPTSAMYTGTLIADFGATSRQTVRFGYRDDGIGHLQQLSPAGGPGFWVGDDLTKFFPVGPGTTTALYSKAARVETPAVGGVYHALGTPPARWWCSQQNKATIYKLANDPLHTVVFASDPQLFTDTVQKLGLRESLHISFYLDPPRTPAEAQANLDRSRALVADIQADLANQGLGNVIAAAFPFERSTELAAQAQSNVLVSITPLAAISVLVGLGGIATVSLQWYQRRYALVRLLAARGASPWALAGLPVAELGLPIVGGGAIGIVLSRLLVPFYAPPGTIAAGAQAAAAGITVGVLALSLILLAAVVGMRAHRDFQVGRLPRGARKSRLLRLVPWELATAGAAFYGWSRLSNYGASSQQGIPLPQVDPAALTYPVFVVLTAGLLAGRIVWLLLRASHRVRIWSRPPLQLAIRRLASARAPVTGVLVVGVLAIGTLAAGTGITAGQRAALDTKSGAVVGSTTRVDVETTVGMGTAALPDSLRGNSTVVGQLTGTGPVVLVVDPATLARGAYLTGLRDQVDALIPQLRAPVPGGLPALRVGKNAVHTASMPGGLPNAVPIADLPWFPVLAGNPGYVISRDALTPAQLASVPRWSLLSTASPEQVGQAMNDAGLTQINGASQAQALDALPFYVVEWTFSFVTVLGAALAVVAVLALLVAIEVRRRQNALSGALVLRMGMGMRNLFGSHLIELGALAGLATLAGVTCGVTVAALAVPGFDPVRWLQPGSALPNQTTFILTSVAAAVLVVLLAGWVAMRSIRTTRTVEVLRG
ncbi:ABC transporter permease [Amycolatopsis taiwanensis]|uniref:ABC transporter permease n=1 Tax=Amycolatopsis taiwanensis TaxID=342230 RepID=UPI0004ACAD23|nr:ABC transporter permease [Amycolatopsis taiwanensis]